MFSMNVTIEDSISSTYVPVHDEVADGYPRLRSHGPLIAHSSGMSPWLARNVTAVRATARPGCACTGRRPGVLLIHGLRIYGAHMDSPEQTIEIFKEQHRMLFVIAYRLLGSVADAEDIVQEAYLRWLEESPTEVQSPKAYLATVVTRLCIDRLRSASRRRELPAGLHFPELVSVSHRLELGETAMLAELLSLALLVVLENLGPLERAVFLLHEVFDYAYAEIAPLVGKSEATCRQSLHRARERLRQRRPRFAASREQQACMVSQFRHASASGDMRGLLALLTRDLAGGYRPGDRTLAVYEPAPVLRAESG